jgi:CBS domain-containing protein
MSSSVETVKESDMLGSALEIMRGLDIRTVPVTDDRGYVIGIVGMKEIIDHNWRRKDRQTVGDLSGKSNQPPILVEAVCATAPKTISWDDNIGKAAEIMLESCISTLPVVENKKLVGVLTQYDIIELMAACKEREMMFIEISGLDDEDRRYYEDIGNAIQHEMAKIAKVKRPQSLTIHVSKYKEQGDNNKYSMNARLIFDGGMIASKEVGWDILRTADDLLKKLTDMVMNIKDTHVDLRKRKK